MESTEEEGLHTYIRMKKGRRISTCIRKDCMQIHVHICTPTNMLCFYLGGEFP